MALKAKKPEAVKKRLKMFLYGPAGVGKSTAAIQFPNSYIIDAEKGTENYDRLINESGSVVLQTLDMQEVIVELKKLLTEKHPYRTLVIDPITPLYNDLLEKSELKVGSEFGRHYGEANKVMKRMANIVMQLDMNVVITAHAKKEYGANLAVLGQTFDGWKSLDYWFDLVIELRRQGTKRVGQIRKTRIEAFPDGEAFEWSYQEIEKRYGADILGKEAATVALASPEQVKQLKELLEVVILPEDTVAKWLTKAQVDVLEDMPAETIVKCIEFTRAKLPPVVTAA